MRKKLLLIVPLPIAGFLVVRALTMTSSSAGDPINDLGTGLIRSLLLLGAVGALFLSARGFVAILRSRN